jgi:hypothetical protein
MGHLWNWFIFLIGHTNKTLLKFRQGVKKQPKQTVTGTQIPIWRVKPFSHPGFVSTRKVQACTPKCAIKGV